MVNKLIAIGAVIAVIAVIIIAARTQKAFASTDVVDINEQTGGIENAIPVTGQDDLEVPIDFGLQGILGSNSEAGTSLEGQQKILSNDIVSEDAIRAINDKLNSVFDSAVGDKGGVLINSEQASSVVTGNNATLTNAKRGSVTQSSIATPALGNRIQGNQLIAGVRGNALPQRAISQTQPTFEGELDTPAGGKRKIAGSQALFDRLRKNLGQS